MPRVMIDDLWLKKDAPSRARRALSQARDPMRAKVPQQYRTGRYGRGKRWRCRWFQPTPNGSRPHSKSFEKREDAEAFQAAMEDDARRGRYHDPRQEQRLLGDVAQEWLKGKLDLRPGTKGRYERELRLYVLPTFGSTPIGSITTQDIQEWAGQLHEGTYAQAEDATRKPRPLSARSMRNIVRIVLGGILGHAASQGWIQSNPVARVALPKPEKPALTIPTPQQVEQIASAMPTQEDRLLVLWQAYTGMRIGETLALRVGDIDIGKRVAHVRQTWAPTVTGGHMLGTPKNGKPRDIAMPRFLATAIKPMLNRDGKAFLFAARRGGPIYEEDWRTRRWYPALGQCGLQGKGITIHSLRHAYASMAIAAGADVKTLQRQLGHSSASITLDVYASLWPSRLGEVADAVGAMRGLA